MDLTQSPYIPPQALVTTFDSTGFATGGTGLVNIQDGRGRDSSVQIGVSGTTGPGLVVQNELLITGASGATVTIGVSGSSFLGGTFSVSPVLQVYGTGGTAVTLTLTTNPSSLVGLNIEDNSNGAFSTFSSLGMDMGFIGSTTSVFSLGFAPNDTLMQLSNAYGTAPSSVITLETYGATASMTLSGTGGLTSTLSNSELLFEDGSSFAFIGTTQLNLESDDGSAQINLGIGSLGVDAFFYSNFGSIGSTEHSFIRFLVAGATAGITITNGNAGGITMLVPTGETMSGGAIFRSMGGTVAYLSDITTGASFQSVTTAGATTSNQVFFAAGSTSNVIISPDPNITLQDNSGTHQLALNVSLTGSTASSVTFVEPFGSLALSITGGTGAHSLYFPVRTDQVATLHDVSGLTESYTTVQFLGSPTGSTGSILLSYAVPANTLVNNGDSLKVLLGGYYQCSTTGSTHSAEVDIYFGSQLVYTIGSSAPSTYNTFTAEVTLVKSDASTVRGVTRDASTNPVTNQATAAVYDLTGLSFSAPINLNFNGVLGQDFNNKVFAEFLTVKYFRS